MSNEISPEAQVSDLTERLRIRSEELAAMTRERDAWKSNEDRARSDHRETIAKLSDSEAYLAEARERLAEREKLLGETEEALHYAKTGIEKAEAERDELREQIRAMDNWRPIAEALRGSKERAEADLARLTSEHAAEVARLTAERNNLAQWKAEAIAVMPDFQAIGQALNIPLGETVHDKILPGILALRSAVEAKDAVLLRFLAELEKIPWASGELRDLQIFAVPYVLSPDAGRPMADVLIPPSSHDPS